MIRPLFVAFLAACGIAGTAAAQAPSRPMPAYQDDERYPSPDASDDRADSRDARRDAGYPRGYGDPSTARADDRRDGYAGYNDVPPPPGYGEDAAHRADRLRTADLNRRASSRTADVAPSGRDRDYAEQSARYRAQLADHERAMQDYGDERARYADRIARWRARASACEAGNIDACQGPE